MNGIKPKTVQKGSLQYDEHTRRYIWFPLHNLDFAWSQGTSPIWNPKIPKGRIVLLESFEYATQVDNTNEFSGGGVVLGTRTMGTDAQISYLMGTNDGVGYLERGMTYLQSLTNVEPSVVIEIEKMLMPLVGDYIEIPKDLLELESHLNKVSISGDNPISNIAKETLREMREGLQRAMTFCMVTANSLERELAEGRAGRLGIKSLNSTQRYYFEQIRRPLPEDRVGATMGDQILRALQPLVGNKPAPSSFQNDMEVELLQQKLKEMEEVNKAMEETIAQQTEVISAYEENTD